MFRTELINAILAKSKSRTKTYLEIGVDNPNSTFLDVVAKKKVAVDPYSDESNKCHVWDKDNRNGFIAMLEADERTSFKRETSDEYFEGLSKQIKFDVIFIDGLHTAEQVEKDVANALNHLKKGGVIILDDALPNSEAEAVPVPKAGAPWRGTIYQYIAKERMNPESEITIMCNDEMNLATIQDKKPKIKAFAKEEFPNPTISYEFYYTFKKDLMNIVSTKELFTKLGLNDE